MSTRVYWKSDIHRLMGKIGDLTVKVAQKMGQEIFTGVVSRSPVRTGSFRASWRMSLHAPDITVTEGGVPGAPLSAPSTPSAPAMKLGDKLFVTNSLPYSLRLEYGWSDQAPAGILRITVQSLGGLGYV